MQTICTLLQTDNHASTPPLSFFTGRMPFLPPNQQHQSTEGMQYKQGSKMTYSSDVAANKMVTVCMNGPEGYVLSHHQFTFRD